jgi:hypothetical protein
MLYVFGRPSRSCKMVSTYNIPLCVELDCSDLARLRIILTTKYVNDLRKTLGEILWETG